MLALRARMLTVACQHCQLLRAASFIGCCGLSWNVQMLLNGKYQTYLILLWQPQWVCKHLKWLCYTICGNLHWLTLFILATCERIVTWCETWHPPRGFHCEGLRSDLLWQSKGCDFMDILRSLVSVPLSAPITRATVVNIWNGVR